MPGQIRKVAVVVLSWNGREHLQTCLPALEAQDDPGVEWEVHVLDNGSQDGTAAWIKRHHPRVRLHQSPKNVGFCSGNNRLIRGTDADAVALLNNDTRPAPGWLAALVEALGSAPRDVAAVSGLIVDWSGERLDFATGIMTFDGHAFQLGYHRALGEVPLPEASADLLFPCGGNLLIRRQSYLEAGGFDERYFAYLEDVDLGWRLWSGGERVTFAPQAVVHHRSMATSNLLGMHNRGFLFERNAFMTVSKNFDQELWPKMMPVVLLVLQARTQSLLVGQNPGGGELDVDPYLGRIADTAVEGKPPESAAGLELRDFAPSRVKARLDELGARELGVRALRKLRRTVLPPSIRRRGAAPQRPPQIALSDPRTVSQLRALSSLLRNLDTTDQERGRVQARRRRADREIFERFPLYVVPTYPGDDALFARPGFRRWLPAEVRFRFAALGEVMEL